MTRVLNANDLTVDGDLLVKRNPMRDRELQRLDTEVMAQQPPCEVLGRNQRRGETSELVFLTRCNGEYGRVVQEGAFAFRLHRRIYLE